MKTFRHYSDDAHGWLMVTETDISDAGLDAGDFSPFSYVNGIRLYLEEDLDASLFLACYTARHGKPNIEGHYESGRSLIRTYRHAPASSYSFEASMKKLRELEPA